MTYDELKAAIEAVVPGCMLEEVSRPYPQDDGEIVIYTGLRLPMDEDGHLTGSDVLEPLP